MTHTLKTALTAATLGLAGTTAAFAGDSNTALQNFVGDHRSFVVVTQGLTGRVTEATISYNTLAVQFVIPTHTGEILGQYVGQPNEAGAFVGKSFLIDEDGTSRYVPVTLDFQPNGVVTADVNGNKNLGGFMPASMQAGY